MRSTPPAVLAVLFTLPLLGLTGCRNACQQLCVEMQAFAIDECGLEFSDAELDSCITEHKGGTLEKGEAGVCRDGRGEIADEWDCDELAVYFEDPEASDGGASDSGE